MAAKQDFQQLSRTGRIAILQICDWLRGGGTGEAKLVAKKGGVIYWSPPAPRIYPTGHPDEDSEEHPE